MRPSTRLLAAAALAGLALLGCWLHARALRREAGGHAAAAALASRLGLTDLALFTEARYTLPSDYDFDYVALGLRFHGATGDSTRAGN